MNFRAILLFSVFILVNIFSSFGCKNSEQKMPIDLSLQIDHLVVGISNLENGMVQFKDLTGIKPVYGGEHPGRGTHNALIALGPRQYLEILAPTPSAEDSYLKNYSKLFPIVFGVSTDNIDLLKEKLEAFDYETTNPTLGSRILPDGSKLEWSILQITKPEIEDAPFFIQWSEQSIHPSETSPQGCQLRSIEVFTPNSNVIQSLLVKLGLDIKVNKAKKSSLKIELESPKGIIKLGSNLED